MTGHGKTWRAILVGVTPDERLNQKLDDRRTDLEMSWLDVARAADIGQRTLSRYRTGEGVRTRETTRKIENALGWAHGYIDAVLSGEEPPEREPDPTPSEENELADLRAKANAAVQLGQEMLARLDVMERRRHKKLS